MTMIHHFLVCNDATFFPLTSYTKDDTSNDHQITWYFEHFMYSDGFIFYCSTVNILLANPQLY